MSEDGDIGDDWGVGDGIENREFKTCPLAFARAGSSEGRDIGDFFYRISFSIESCSPRYDL